MTAYELLDLMAGSGDKKQLGVAVCETGGEVGFFSTISVEGGVETVDGYEQL